MNLGSQRDRFEILRTSLSDCAYSRQDSPAREIGEGRVAQSRTLGDHAGDFLRSREVESCSRGSSRGCRGVAIVPP